MGEYLPSERSLMVRFGVGRPSIREALASLRRMGLIEMRQGTRPRIIDPTPVTLLSDLSGLARRSMETPEGMKSFQQARSLFEAALADNAARHATPEDLAALEAALLANRKALGHARLFQQTDVAFHYVLAQIQRNPLLTSLHAAMADWLAEQRAISSLAPGSGPAAYKAHERIYQAIAARRPEEASQAMRDHLAEVASYYWSARSEGGVSRA